MSTTDYSLIQVTPDGNYDSVRYVRILPLKTTKSLVEITTAGYLNRILKDTSQTVRNGDLVNAFYAIQADGSGLNAIFTVAISAGVITLAQLSNPSEVTFVGSPIIGNFPVVVDLAGNIGDSGIASNIVLQAPFASPDVNANMTFTLSGTISNASIVAGLTLFTPTGATQYILQNVTMNVTQSFAGGSNNSNLSLGVGATTMITATAATIKAAAQSYALGQAGFTRVGGENLITNANPLKLVLNASSDYTGGGANFNYTLVRIV